MFLVDIRAFRLAIWAMRATNSGSFVPLQAGPCEIGEKFGFRVRDEAFLVCVLYAEQELAASSFGEEVAEERCSKAADVEVPCG
jgi:hypothetical protein